LWCLHAFIKESVFVQLRPYRPPELQPRTTARQIEGRKLPHKADVRTECPKKKKNVSKSLSLTLFSFSGWMALDFR